MLSRCCRQLLQVLGPSSPLLTCQTLLCVSRLMKPLVVFVLGGPGAGKGTQCARIVEVRPGGDGLLSWSGRGRSAPPTRPRTTCPGVHRAARGRGRGATAHCVSGRGARGHLRRGPLRVALLLRHLFESFWGLDATKGWETGLGRQPRGPARGDQCSQWRGGS